MPSIHPTSALALKTITHGRGCPTDEGACRKGKTWPPSPCGGGWCRTRGRGRAACAPAHDMTQGQAHSQRYTLANSCGEDVLPRGWVTKVTPSPQRLSAPAQERRLGVSPALTPKTAGSTRRENMVGNCVLFLRPDHRAKPVARPINRPTVPHSPGRLFASTGAPAPEP